MIVFVFFIELIYDFGYFYYEIINLILRIV